MSRILCKFHAELRTINKTSRRIVPALVHRAGFPLPSLSALRHPQETGEPLQLRDFSEHSFLYSHCTPAGQPPENLLGFPEFLCPYCTTCLSCAACSLRLLPRLLEHLVFNVLHVFGRDRCAASACWYHWSSFSTMTNHFFVNL